MSGRLPLPWHTSCGFSSRTPKFGIGLPVAANHRVVEIIGSQVSLGLLAASISSTQHTAVCRIVENVFALLDPESTLAALGSILRLQPEWTGTTVETCHDALHESIVALSCKKE